jgi:hypothetical protein
MVVVFGPEAILECGDRSPLFNETIGRRVHQRSPVWHYQQLRDTPATAVSFNRAET